MQTCLVAVWIVANVVAWAHFDPYPFILLNLAFSLQAAYAAPLILLAQTRQADRDKTATEADALHREAIAANQAQLLLQNTELTEQVAILVRQIDRLTRDIHGKVAAVPDVS